MWFVHFFMILCFQMAKKAKKMAKVTQRPMNMNARKGEADRRILTSKPRHLFAGKRKMGKTDRRWSFFRQMFFVYILWISNHNLCDILNCTPSDNTILVLHRNCESTMFSFIYRKRARSSMWVRCKTRWSIDCVDFCRLWKQLDWIQVIQNVEDPCLINQ
jgi:hypothetical protein